MNLIFLGSEGFCEGTLGELPDSASGTRTVFTAAIVRHQR